MITKFNNYINESYENKEYGNTLEIITKLVNDGNIILKDTTPEKITDLIIGKNKKYPQFGFENFMLSASNGKMFISEGDKERMGDYIQRIKDLDIECTGLEKLYKYYKEYYDLYNKIEKTENELHRNTYLEEKEREELADKLETFYGKLDGLESYIDDFKNELQKISKIVVEKL
jgi:hypothetical protein